MCRFFLGYLTSLSVIAHFQMHALKFRFNLLTFVHEFVGIRENVKIGGGLPENSKKTLPLFFTAMCHREKIDRNGVVATDLIYQYRLQLHATGLIIRDPPCP